MKLHLFLLGIGMLLMLAMPLSASPIAFEKEVPGYSTSRVSDHSTSAKRLKKGSFLERFLLKRVLKKANKKKRPDTEEEKMPLGKLAFFISIGSIPFLFVPLVGLLSPVAALIGSIMGLMAMNKKDGFGWGLAAFLIGGAWAILMTISIFSVFF
jgi:hypothetical protein